MTKFDRIRAILSVKYFENELHPMYPMKNIQAVLLIFADVEVCLQISTSGEGFQNLLR